MIDEYTSAEKIRLRIITLQRDLIHQKEQSESLAFSNQEQWMETFLQIIDVIDLIEQLEQIEVNKYQKKIKKRLLSILSNHDISRIEIQDHKVVPEFTKVVGTKNCPDISTGNIIEICRHGYLWKGKVVRLAEVITACDESKAE